MILEVALEVLISQFFAGVVLTLASLITALFSLSKARKSGRLGLVDRASAWVAIAGGVWWAVLTILTMKG